MASARLVLLVTIFLELLTAVASARLVSLVTYLLAEFLTVASAQMLIPGLALQDYQGCSRGLEHEPTAHCVTCSSHKRV